MNGGNAVNMLKQAEALLKDRDSLVKSAEKVAKTLAIDTVVQLYKSLGACEAMFKKARVPLSEKMKEWTIENGDREVICEDEEIKGVTIPKEVVRTKAQSKKWKFSISEFDRFNVDQFKKNAPVDYVLKSRQYHTRSSLFRVDPVS